MKIDMLAMASNLTNCQDAKKGQDGLEFFKVFNSELTETSIEESGHNPYTNEEDMEDEVMAAIVAIINKMLNVEVRDDVGSSGDLKKVNELIEGMTISELFNPEKLKEMYSGKQIEDLLKKLNVDLENPQNLQKIEAKEVLLKVLNEAVEKVEIKNNTFEQNETDILGEGTIKNQSYKTDSNDDYRKIINIIAPAKEEKVFELGNLKHRNIIIEEKPSNLQGELNLLNRIAFSSNNITETPKETAPVVVRNEFLGADVLKVVKYISNNKIEELNVKITPRELGEVNIKLLKAEDSNELIITLTNKKAYELIKENVTDIEKHLANLDIKVKEVVVQVKNEVFSDFSGSFNEQFSKNSSREERKNNFTKEVNSIEEEQENEKDESNINLLV